MARADVLILLVGVTAIVVVIVAGALRQAPQAPSEPEKDCPELEPVARIPALRAMVVMSATYVNIDLWGYGPSAIVKWCQATGEWWVSLNTNKSTYLCTAGESDVTCSLFLGTGNHSFGPWSPHPNPDDLPTALLSYAWNAQADLVLFVLRASLVFGALPLVDAGFVDAETSQLIVKVRVAE